VSEVEPLSPCIAVCVLDPATGYCRGCFRTIAEISHWVLLAGAEKRRILAALPARRGQGTSRVEA
jgi:predicted Fe-S protein YdhL (DUF1289 family)